MKQAHRQNTARFGKSARAALFKTRDGKSAQPGPKSGVDFQSDDDEAEVIWNKVSHVKKQVRDSETRTLRLAQQTVDIGTKTLGELASQREQLEKINKDVGATTQNLDEGESLLKEMKQPWYKALGKALRLPPRSNPSNNSPGVSPAKSESPNQDMINANSASTSKTSLTSRWRKTSKAAPEPEDDDSDKLDQIGALLATMQSQANQINLELKQTSKQVDVLVDKTADNAIKAAKNNERTKAHRKGFRERERIWKETEDGIFPGGEFARMAMT